MMDLLNLLFKGLSLGCLYALSAMGFNILFKTSKFINFAHGEFMAIGAFVFLLLSAISGMPVSLAFLLTVSITLVLFFVIERLFIRPVTSNDKAKGIFMSLGIILILKGIITFVLNGRVLKCVIAPVESASNSSGIYSNDVTALIIGVIFILLLFFFLRQSSTGLYIKAIADNKKAALSLGIPIDRLITFAWVIAGIAASVSGILLTIGTSLNGGNLDAMESKIFPAIILGGIGSMSGSILGGLLMGIIEICAGGHGAGPLKDLFPYLIIVLILVVKPYGIFSDKAVLNRIKQ